MEIYVRMLAIDVGRPIDWAAAQAELERLKAESEDDEDLLDADVVTRLRHVFEHPSATGLRTFEVRAAQVFLAVGLEWEPPESLQVIRQAEEFGILEAAGLEFVSTA